MSERDPVIALLKELDRPLAPRPEFGDALRERVLAELAQQDGLRARRRLPRPRLPFPPRRRRAVLAGAVALAVAATAVTAILSSRPSPASALDVIHEARRAFVETPPFEATLRVDLNPTGSKGVVPKGATATVAVSYGGPERFRMQFVDEEPRLRAEDAAGTYGPGSYQVFDGRSIGSFDTSLRRKIFHSSPAPNGFRPLDFLSWNGGYPDWERICRGPDSEVLPDARIAGRDANHIRCGDFTGNSWELWIDRETGLMLKVVGQVGGDDFFFGLSTSAKGGFTVERLRYNPSFPAGTFEVAGPPGVPDYRGRIEAAMAKLPPFRAVFSVRSGARNHVDEVWWASDRSWRREVLVDRKPGTRGSGGAGSFFVWADGRMGIYNARDDTYERASSLDAGPDPMAELLPESLSSYSTARCPIVGYARIAGRAALHRRCTKALDIWVDSSTGIELRRRFGDFELRVRSIEYDPAFPPGTFRFDAPEGSKSARQVAKSPYYKTRLGPGKVAPNWRAELLGGDPFELADLRGKPALLLLVPDWCPAGDDVCDVFEPLQQAYRRSKDEVAIVWVDSPPAVNAERAREIVRHNHLTFPVVIDTNDTSRPTSASFESWKVQAWPFWLLLDSDGRVIEARLGPQTTAQLTELLAKARP
jgi:thiol-disulfide isomerase/thioredoxin